MSENSEWFEKKKIECKALMVIITVMPHISRVSDRGAGANFFCPSSFFASSHFFSSHLFFLYLLGFSGKIFLTHFFQIIKNSSSCWLSVVIFGLAVVLEVLYKIASQYLSLSFVIVLKIVLEIEAKFFFLPEISAPLFSNHKK